MEKETPFSVRNGRSTRIPPSAQSLFLYRLAWDQSEMQQSRGLWKESQVTRLIHNFLTLRIAFEEDSFGVEPPHCHNIVSANF